MVEIVNNAKNLPRGAVRHVRRSLAWIHSPDLEGVSFIELVDKTPTPTDASPKDVKEAFNEGYDIFGVYHRQSNDGTPYITLNMGDIYAGVPSICYWTTVPILIITYTLAHEVGHHVVAKRGYINKPSEKHQHKQYEEAFANRYTFALLERMHRKWYYRVGEWIIKNLAEWQYNLGIHCWNRSKYEEAAKHWHTAFSLNPDHNEASFWYWRARAMCNSVRSSGRNVDA